MNNLFDENHFPRTDDSMPPQSDYVLPEEDRVPREEPISYDEFNVHHVSKLDDGTNKRSVKKVFLKPIVAVVAVVSVVFASYAVDPLGKDFLNGGSSVSPATPTTPSGTSDSTDTSSDTTVETETDVSPTDDDVFPTLGNLDPDFAGAYAWSGDGSEEYIRFARDGDTAYSYLVKGGAWNVYDSAGQIVDDSSAVYDKITNTLTLKNFTAAALDVNLMGNGFTIELVGDNKISGIQIWGAMYGGSLTFTGDGSLTVTGGLLLNCEASESCLIVKNGVTLDISGDSFAVMVSDSAMDDSAIYVSKYLEVSGGENKLYTTNEYSGITYYSYSFLDESGEPSTHVIIKPEK